MDFFTIVMIIFIIIANVIGLLVFLQKRSIYFAALTILCLAAVFGGAGSILAIVIIRDPFSVFFGLQIGYILLMNSGIVLLIAALTTLLRKMYKRN
ncbi:3-isopropylmalate dehydrogenase [Bacillus sp. CRN 9]|uniref:3-isopropylmalate dehydrogenase n=1 Tax=Cytobacillus horneckiae TaxID=549687 RepID=UPI001C27A249